MNNKFSLTFISFIFVSFSCSNIRMGKGKENESFEPNSNMSTVEINRPLLSINLSAIGDNARVLFHDKTCVIAGVDTIPNTLLASSEFEPSALPSNLKVSFFDIKNIILRLPFVSQENQVIKFNSIPSWLNKMNKLNYLRLDYFELSSLSFLTDAPIKHLVLNEIMLKERNSIINDFSELKNLKYLAHNNLFTESEVLIIKEKLPDLAILTEEEYYKKVESGEILVK